MLLQLQWQYETVGEIAIMRLQLLMQLSKRAETKNDVLKSKEFTVVQFKKSQHAFVNIEQQTFTVIDMDKN